MTARRSISTGYYKSIGESIKKNKKESLELKNKINLKFNKWIRSTLNIAEERNDEPEYRLVENIQTEPQRKEGIQNRGKEGKRYMGHCKLLYINV